MGHNPTPQLLNLAFKTSPLCLVHLSRWTDGQVCLTMRNMELNDLGADALQLVEEILGYLNFSSGASDPTFLKNLNDLFGRIDTGDKQRRADLAAPGNACFARLARY